MIQRARVLIVEDNTMIADYVASVLEARGFAPVHALSLAQARQRLQAGPAFDLCLCDRWLPDGEGTALVADLGGTPAIAMTAHLDSGDREQLLGAGFSQVLLKPCSPETLERVILGVLDTRRTAGSTTAASDPEDTAERPVLDDAAALRMSGGSREIMMRLRSLLHAELPGIRRRLQEPDPDEARREALAAELHKLAASAGWCGASELAARCDGLRRAIASGADSSPERATMLAAVERLSQALTGGSTSTG